MRVTVYAVALEKTKVNSAVPVTPEGTVNRPKLAELAVAVADKLLPVPSAIVTVLAPAVLST